MEKAIHYQWSAVRNFHSAISSAVDDKRLSWDDMEIIRMKSNTHFSHGDLRNVGTLGGQRDGHRNTRITGQSREVKSRYCEQWNNMGNCECSTSDPRYKDIHLCKVCDNAHPKLSCALSRFPIPSPNP